MDKTKKNINNEKNSEKKCQLCRAGFDVWLSTLNFNPEREEKIRAHFSRYCPDCGLSEKEEKKGKIKNIITA
jgi:hypothetical protein